MAPLDIVKRVVERKERKAAGRRAKAIAKSGPFGDALQQQITAAVAASAAAEAAATIVIAT